ncbi:MAG TPA: hypothetical protein VF780_07045 [Nitrosospira sp.]
MPFFISAAVETAENSPGTFSAGAVGANGNAPAGFSDLTFTENMTRAKNEAIAVLRRNEIVILISLNLLTSPDNEDIDSATSGQQLSSTPGQTAARDPLKVWNTKYESA